MNKKSGVSLIVIVISILVMATLSSVVVFSLKNDNHIDYAYKTVLISDLKSAQLELSKNNDPLSINAENEAVKNYIPSLKKDYVGKVKIVNGKLYLVKDKFSSEEVRWLGKVGIGIEVK